MWVGKSESGGEGTQDYIAKLDAGGRNNVAKGEVIFAQEFREVVQENQDKPESTAIKVRSCWLNVLILEEWVQKLEQGNQQLVERRPSLNQMSVNPSGKTTSPYLSIFCQQQLWHE